MFAAALALLTFAAAPVPKDLPKAPATPEGEWKLVEMVRGGRPVDVKSLGATVTIKDGMFTVTTAQGNEPATFTFDPKATPATMDIKHNEKGESVVKAIYKLDNDKLTICFINGGGNRPTKFESPACSGTGLLVMERVKK